MSRIGTWKRVHPLETSIIGIYSSNSRSPWKRKISIYYLLAFSKSYTHWGISCCCTARKPSPCACWSRKRLGSINTKATCARGGAVPSHQENRGWIIWVNKNRLLKPVNYVTHSCSFILLYEYKGPIKWSDTHYSISLSCKNDNHLAVWVKVCHLQWDCRAQVNGFTPHVNLFWASMQKSNGKICVTIGILPESLVACSTHYY